MLKISESRMSFSIKVLAVSSSKMSKKKKTQGIWDLKMFCLLMTGVCVYYQCTSSIEVFRKVGIPQARREGKRVSQRSAAYCNG